MQISICLNISLAMWLTACNRLSTLARLSQWCFGAKQFCAGIRWVARLNFIHGKFEL